MSNNDPNFYSRLYQAISWRPNWLEKSAWIGHLPFASWVVQEVNPKTLVELGTHLGTSYFAFCQSIKENNLKTRCIAVDTWSGDDHAGFYKNEVFSIVQKHNNLKYKDFSDLIRLTFDEACKKIQDKSIYLLHIDGLHTYEAVKHDFTTWLPKLASGALVLFHDIKVTHGDFGVWKFWQEIKNKYKHHTEFRHCNGLGVLQIPCENKSLHLSWLKAGSIEARTVVEMMEGSGKALESWARLNELQKEKNKRSKLENYANFLKQPFEIDLYYSVQNQMFDEACKYSEALKLSPDEFTKITVLINGEASAADRWRFDLGKKPGFYEIKQIKILDQSGEEIWDFSSSQKSNLQFVDMEWISVSSNIFCCTSSDPQILLQALNLQNRKIALISIQIREFDMYQGFSLYADKKNEEIKNKNIKYNELEKNNSLLRQKLSQANTIQTALESNNTVLISINEKLQLTKTLLESNSIKISDIGNLFKNIKNIGQSRAVNYLPSFFSVPLLLHKLRTLQLPTWIYNHQTSINQKKQGFFRGLEQKIRKRRKLLQAKWGFDKDWYLKNNIDVKISGCDPLQHYLQFGLNEGRTKNKYDRPTFNKNATLPNNYNRWLSLYDTLNASDEDKIIKKLRTQVNWPNFSVIMPVFNPRLIWLRQAIDSVRNQIYPNWQLCIADDASTNSDVIQYLNKVAVEDRRISISYRKQRGDISKASNDALLLAKHDWVVLLDHDDELKKDSLFWVAQAIMLNSGAKIIYSDEDKINDYGFRSDPFFKPDWNQRLLLSYNYFCHLLALNKKMVQEIGAFRTGFEGAQDYDLVLRCVEKCRAEEIVHIPRILYHWRVHSQSTAAGIGTKPRAEEAGQRALTEHLARTKVSGTVNCVPGGYRVIYKVKRKPLVSIIIPTRDQAEILKKCVDSIVSKTLYRNYEIIIIDNGSTEDDSLALLKKYKSQGISVIKDYGSFNYSRLNNKACKTAKGDLLHLMNNDIEITMSEWLDVMVSEIMQKQVGVVGAKLLYPKGTIQHAGVILGVGGVAGHVNKNAEKDTAGYFSRARLSQDLSACTAACLLIKRELFKKVGGLDEKNLKVAFNDVDLCLKIRKLGFRIIWTPFAQFIHHESLSRGLDESGEKRIRFIKEINFMKKKWAKELINDPHYNPNLSLENENNDFAFPPRLDHIWSLNSNAS